MITTQRQSMGDPAGPAGSPVSVDGLRSQLVRIAVIPATVITGLGFGAATVFVFDNSLLVLITVLAVALPASVFVLIFAGMRASTAARATQAELANAHAWASYLRTDIGRFIGEVSSGEQPAPDEPSDLDPNPANPLAAEFHETRRVLKQAISEAVRAKPSDNRDKRVEVFVTLSHRLQSLVHREIQKLDELEHEVEDPDLLKGLFYVDHLATGVRRQAENLAVLGGAVPRRHWNTSVSVYAVLRSAVAEVEQYARVKVVQPIEGSLRGDAVAEVIHLVAELVENATKFSQPDTQVQVRARKVTAGLAIEIEDRGLGMDPEDQQRMNELFATPGHLDLSTLLTDGRIGLWVVSELARRHEVAVRLRNNIFGGTDAAIVLPQRLLGNEQEPQPDAQQAQVPPKQQPKQLPQQPQPQQPSQPTRRETRASLTGQLSPDDQLSTVGAGTGPSRHAAHATDRPRERQPARQRESTQPTSRMNGRHYVRPNEPSQPARTSNGQHAEPSDAARPDRSGFDSTPAPDNNDGRPPLPQRRAKSSHLIPELRDTGIDQDPVSEPNLGLMGSFQDAINQSISRDDDPSESRPN